MDELIPILGIIFVIGPISSLVFSYTPLGRAVIDRLRGRTSGSDETILQLHEDIDRLQEQIAFQDQRFEELHDRLDFTERLLASRSEVPDQPETNSTPA